MHQVIQMWEMFNGSFEPVGPHHYGLFISPTSNTINDTLKAINGKSPMLCINDHNNINSDEFEFIRNTIINAFENKFPQKSSFEI